MSLVEGNRQRGGGQEQRRVPEDLQGAAEEEEESQVGEGVEDEEDWEDERAPEAGQEGGGGGIAGVYNPRDVNDQIFDELALDSDVVAEVQNAWNLFVRSAESRDAAGQAIYAALFDAAPSLQVLFKTPRGVMAMRFMNGLTQLIGGLQDPKALKVIVETLGFQHMDLEVTSPRVMVFRDAIVDLIQDELDGQFSQKARDGWCTFMNYVGGAYIYVRVKYSDRLGILACSWATANKRQAAEEGSGAAAEGPEGNGSERGPAESGGHGGGARARTGAHAAKDPAAAGGESAKKGWLGSSRGSGSSPGTAKTSMAEKSMYTFNNTAVPTTYPDMFMFNAAVMGFGGRPWMLEVLCCFDGIVSNVSNSYRLQEECDVLSLRIARCRSGSVNLPEYKAVMLASLRSLVPKDWDSAHEVAWSWLWENVERMLKATMGKPPEQEVALEELWASLDDETVSLIRRELYSKFFALAPTGQDYFKQSTTRLHFVADKVRSMSLELYKDPKKMVDDLSAMGLRHVGYGIPTELFGPFVTAAVHVVRQVTDDDVAEEAFRWSLGLVSRILTRVINEGSTVVMKAINANSAKHLRKAVGCAPRGARALWVLKITVGTQSISPLVWAIEAGSLEAARAIFVDLFTIRADRDRYYYGVDALFERHPDIIRRLCLDAPALLPTFLDGLVWRSRTTENGRRRVNYYLQHLVVDGDGGFSKGLEWLVELGDPKIICHPVLVLVTDTIWLGAALRTFILGKAWFFFTLLVFASSQAILSHVGDVPPADVPASADPLLAAGNSTTMHLTTNTTTMSSSVEAAIEDDTLQMRTLIFAFRCFVYFCNLSQSLFSHARKSIRDCRERRFIKLWHFRVPEYLANWQDFAFLLLTICLVLMLCLEPILHCASNNGGNIFTQQCEEAKPLIPPYSWSSCAAMLLYFLLLCDVSVLSTRVSSFALVCGRMLSEVALFLFGLSFFVIAFSTAISALKQTDPDFAGIPKSAMMLYEITFGMFSDTHFERLSDHPTLMVAIFIYVIGTVVFFLNLLVSQLSCAYQATFLDMVGYARLNRARIVTETMPSVPRTHWQRFLVKLRLDERVEFGEGDLGLAGGIQMKEPASHHITTADTIRRFGGTTSPGAQWPADDSRGDAGEEDRFDRMERMIGKALKRAGGGKRGSGQLGSSLGQSESAQDSGSVGGSMSE